MPKLKVNADRLDTISPLLEAIFWVRDMITTPAEEMNPKQLGIEAKKLAEMFQASFHEIVGDDLLKHGYRGIYTVGRAAVEAPRLIDIHWGNTNHPKLTLVGKGVCFDSGGLDLKAAEYMLLMRKDMGGAAHVLGLAYMIMQANLPVRLRVLIPAVENCISSKAYRPGDVIVAKNGTSIEVGNTDAEGRVVLADALVEAASESPDLMIDFATLTGAARVALGLGLPALFCNRADIANQLVAASFEAQDPLWQLPLFAPYKKYIKGKIADLTNNPPSYGAAITAALFLEQFVQNHPWLHIDLMAWNDSSTPGKPEGGEAMGIRALFAYLTTRYTLA
jgi:leucyl aminopeptidase